MDYNKANNTARNIYYLLLGKKFESKQGYAIRFFPETNATTLFDNYALITSELNKDSFVKYTIVPESETNYKIVTDKKIYKLDISDLYFDNAKGKDLLILSVQDSQDGSKILFEESL
jgi:hypothetical protein